MKPLKVFLSYSSKDSRLSGQLKEILENIGFDVFLAHDDIHPSEKWQKRILQELRKTDIFIPVLTRNFRHSLWTDQESGIAFENSRAKILPFRIHLNPYGFLAKFQALKVTKSQLPKIGASLLNSLTPPMRLRYYRSLPAILQRVRDHEPLLAISEVLHSSDSLKKAEANRILRSSLSNPRVFLYAGVRRHLKEFIRKNNKLLDPDLVAQFQMKLPK